MVENTLATVEEEAGASLGVRGHPGLQSEGPDSKQNHQTKKQKIRMMGLPTEIAT